ncbi:MAG: hypothetical protein FWD47_10100 [Treponema sp.]|nr:hypothetical protein [Treponema sp.]
MKKSITLFIIIFIMISGVSAQITFSGILDSTVSMNIGAEDSPAFSCGIEEFANIRFQARIQDKATVFGAVNLIAASGNNALAMAGMGIGFFNENFASVIELERLYFRLRGEHVDIDGGLFRLPFGYGQVWGPSDFLNPKNPLKPDARPRAILGTALIWYPADELKLLAFYSAPRDPFSNEGEGSFIGFSLDKHWVLASIQGLYSFETPYDNFKLGVHRIGFSLKADIIVGLVIDALYTYNHEAGFTADGLSFSIGFDSSFFDGDMIFLIEYLYNGKTSSTAEGFGGNFSNNHYLYTGLTWIFNSFTNMNIALISSFDDISFTPIVSLNHDLFQGAALTVSVQVPFDLDTFYGVNLSTKLRLRF